MATSPETRPEFIDLKRRYQEADSVSEFQRLWAIFNHWLTTYTRGNNDRLCIEALKAKRIELERWARGIIEATPGHKRPHNIGDGFGGSYPRFAIDNEISRFFRNMAASRLLEQRIHHPWRHGSDTRVRATNAITLSIDQFNEAYGAHANVLGSNITFNLTIHQTLPVLGVGATGSCFYRRPKDTTLPPGTVGFADMMVTEFRRSNKLAGLVHLIESTDQTDLTSDIIESLYNVRNLAMHGGLDFLDSDDNAAARAGFDLLDRLVCDIRDRW